MADIFKRIFLIENVHMPMGCLLYLGEIIQRDNVWLVVTWGCDLIITLTPELDLSVFKDTYPAGTWRNKNVIITSKRRHNVVLT